MNYESLRIKDNKIDTIPKKVVITKSQIESATAKVNEVSRIKLEGTKTTGTGICFMGPYDVVIADFSYSEEKGRPVLRMNRNAEKQYARQYKKAEHKKAVRTFVLKRVLPVAGAVIIAGSGLWYLIDSAIDAIKLSPDSEVSTIDVADVNIIPLEDADIPVVLEWANYAMGEYYDVVSNSEYSEYVTPGYDRLYADSFMPLNSTYENYYELASSGLPDEMIGGSLDNNLNSFRNYAEQINEVVPKSAQYENTVFSRAIVLQEDLDNAYAYDVPVYIPLAELEETEYSIDNLPDDAIIYEGEVYVRSTHIYDQVKSDSKQVS